MPIICVDGEFLSRVIGLQQDLGVLFQYRNEEDKSRRYHYSPIINPRFLQPDEHVGLSVFRLRIRKNHIPLVSLSYANQSGDDRRKLEEHLDPFILYKIEDFLPFFGISIPRVFTSGLIPSENGTDEAITLKTASN